MYYVYCICTHMRVCTQHDVLCLNHTVSARSHMLNTAVHEIIHALGFSSDGFSKWSFADTGLRMNTTTREKDPKPAPRLRPSNPLGIAAGNRELQRQRHAHGAHHTAGGGGGEEPV